MPRIQTSQSQTQHINVSGFTITHAARFFVWLTFALSSLVFREPPPFDILMMGLIVLLPMARLVSVTPSILFLLGAWLIITAAGLIASMISMDMRTSTVHTLITFYLGIVSVLLASFIQHNPAKHIMLVMSGYLVAGVISVGAAIAGYFSLFPGANELFVLEGARARGTFKDPNVFGPFLVLPAVWMLHLTMTRPFKQTLLPSAFLIALVFSILISFSRGAWIHLALSFLLYGYFSIVTAKNNLRRMKLIILGALGMICAAGLIVASLQIDSIRQLLSERASFTQSYDTSSSGRFAGHQMATRMMLENPLGIGALEFARILKNGDVHNVYLNMFLSAGWLGGFLYLGMVLATLFAGFRHILRETQHRGIFLAAYVTFVGVAGEAIIIDTEHWRHFYVLLGILWGLMAAHYGQYNTKIPHSANNAS